MKIDLIYPKIPENTNVFIDKCYAFEKYDGTNLHWAWNLVKGWHSFGTRRTQFSLNRNGIDEFTQTHPELQAAPHIFNDKMRDSLTSFLCRFKTCAAGVIIFTEFYGPNSFAGGHSEEDARCNTQKLTIIDVSIGNKIISPRLLIEDFDSFGGFDVAKVVYRGKYTGQFTEDVRKGKFNVNEGVVVKGIVNGEVFMTKIKTKDYLKRLQER